ncbi:MAG: DUF4124 domain-containing protein [Motiliproteus sp.]
MFIAAEKRRIALRYLILALLASLLPTLATADIYRWIDDNGTASYGQRPPLGVEFELIKRTPTAAVSESTKRRPPESIREYLKSTQKNESVRTGAVARNTAKQEAPVKANAGRKGKSDRRKKEFKTLAETLEAYRSRKVLNTFRSRGDLTVEARAKAEKAMTDELRKKPESLSKKRAAKAAKQ